MTPIASSSTYNDEPLVITWPVPFNPRAVDGFLVKQRVRAELAKGRRVLVLELSELIFLDSRDLGALLTVASELDRAGGSLTVAGASEDMRSLLAYLGGGIIETRP